MATSWKKILISGSDIEVGDILSTGDSIKFSGLGSLADNSLLAIDSTGAVSVTSVGSVGGAKTFVISGSDLLNQMDPSGSVSGTGTIFSTDHRLAFTQATASDGTIDAGFGFVISTANPDGNNPATTTASIQLQAPQDLKTSADVTFGSVTIGDSGIIRDANQKITFTNGVSGLINLLQGGVVREELAQNQVTFNPTGVDYDFIVESQGLQRALFIDAAGGPDTSGSIVIGGGSSEDTTTSAANNRLRISGSTLIEGAITASDLPFDSTSTGIVVINSSGVLGTGSLSNFNLPISGAIDDATGSLSSSLAIDIAANAVALGEIDDIQTNISGGLRVQAGAGAVDGSVTGIDGESITFGQTASFIGAANELEVTHDGGTAGEEKFTIGLRDTISSSIDMTIQTLTASLGISASGDVTASGLFIDNDLAIGGDIFSTTGLTIIENVAVSVTGSNLFGSGSAPADVEQQLTGSVFITGSQLVLADEGDLTLESGSLSILHGHAFVSGDLTASGVISGSSHLFASLSSANKDQVVVYDTATGKFFHTASSALSVDLVLGEPQDGSFGDDGLFDFTPGTTTITDAVDDINEVLLALAPSPAPSLSDISTITSVATNLEDGTPDSDTQTQNDNNASDAKLAFGASNGFSGYTNVTGLHNLTAPAGISFNPTDQSVDVDGDFDYSGTPKADGGERLGVFTGTGSISGVLNEDVAQNPTDTGTAHGSNAFKDGNVGDLYLFVNNDTVAIHTMSLAPVTGGLANVNGDGGGGSGFINISATQSAHFPSGIAFAAFNHRSASFTIASGSQGKGWNYAKVIHSSSTFARQTNYIEWVNDPLGAVTDVTITAQSLDHRSSTGTTYISQIPYFTNATFNYTCSFDNFYTMTYDPDGITLLDNHDQLDTTGLDGDQGFDSTITPNPIGNNPDPTSYTTTISASGTTDNSTAYYYTSSLDGGSSNEGVGAGLSTHANGFGNGIEVQTRVKKALRSKVDSTALNTGSIFLYRKSTSGNTNSAGVTTINFLGENLRLTSQSDSNGTFMDQSDVSSGNDWNSQTSGIIANNAMIVYGQPDGIQTHNRIISPTSDTFSYKNGNFAALSTENSNVAPAALPNLNGVSNIITLFIKHTNGSSAAPAPTVTIKGINTEFVDGSQTLSANKMHAFFKIPGKTGFRDMAKSFSAAEAGATPLADGVGCFAGNTATADLTLGSSNDTATFNLELGGQAQAASELAVLFLECHKDWEGYIYEIVINDNV